MPLIAEDLLLLLLDDESGRVAGSDTAEAALGAAVLAELAILGLVRVEERASRWRSQGVEVTGEPAQDRVLADALDVVAQKPRSAQELVGRLGQGLVRTLGDRLVERGVLERRDSRLLGLVPRTRWPVVDRAREQDLRTALTSVLVQGTTPDERTGVLVAVLAALGRAHRVVDRDGVRSRDVKERAAEVAEGDWAPAPVRDALQATHAAVVAVVAAAVAATGSV